MNAYTTVDEYIAIAPSSIRKRLADIRAVIRSAAPASTERISYGMPYYGYKGRLVYFAAFKNHIGLYLPGPTLEAHMKELAGYVTAKATVRFPHDQKLPLPLIKKLVTDRVKRMDKV